MPSGYNKYPYLKFRRGVWREIVRFVHVDIGHVGTLLELGAGYCDFINQFPADKKICYELNPDMQRWVEPDVIFINKEAISIDSLENASVDLVFASNFLEHLDKDELQLLLPKIFNVLKQGGKFVLLQPNYRLCEKQYFSDVTHKTIFSDQNIKSFLERFGFIVTRIIPGLLPLQMKSRLPKWPLLVRLYLSMPIKPRAAQMYVVAIKE